MATVMQKIKDIEDEMARTQKNKATAHHLGLLKIWEYLDLLHIFTKPKGTDPDYEDPVILSSKKRTVEDFCNRIHKDMIKQFKYVNHKPQRVGKDHELEDDKFHSNSQEFVEFSTLRKQIPNTAVLRDY